jgi:hypothetical protein
MPVAGQQEFSVIFYQRNSTKTDKKFHKSGPQLHPHGTISTAYSIISKYSTFKPLTRAKKCRVEFVISIL